MDALLPARGRHHAVGEPGQDLGVDLAGSALCLCVLESVTNVVADVDLAGLQPGQRGAAHAVLQLRPNVGRVQDELVQECAQAGELRVQDGADAQLALCARAEPLRGGSEVIQSLERAVGMRQQRLPLPRENDTRRGAGEQLELQQRLQFLQLEADRRLAEEKLARRARHVAFPGDSGEGAQQAGIGRAERHWRSLYQVRLNSLDA